MAFSFNTEIESLFADYDVPVSWIYYDGDEDTYITYQQTDKGSPYSAEDGLRGYVLYYDFDVFSKGNYFDIIDDIITIMTDAGWVYQPGDDGPDLFEKDTGMFHKTISFAKESEV